jgi:hypothetical protein
MADDTFAPPSIDPPDEGSLGGAFRAILQKVLQGVEDCLPAQVIAYDRRSNRATVKPLIMMGTTDGEKVSRAQIASVPVFNIGGGGFVLSFPIKPNDLGWIKASDRDISLFLQGMKEEWPNTRRSHSFSDGVFFPDVMRQWTLNAGDTESAVLQSIDGATRIAIGAGTVTITAPTLVKIDCPSAYMTGNLDVDGIVTIGGTAFNTHNHADPQGGDTGGPKNP